MMTPLNGPVVRVKPASNVYTALLVVAILVLAIATGVVLYDLIQNYGYSIADLFGDQKVPSI